PITRRIPWQPTARAAAPPFNGRSFRSMIGPPISGLSGSSEGCGSDPLDHAGPSPAHPDGPAVTPRIKRRSCTLGRLAPRAWLKRLAHVGGGAPHDAAALGPDPGVAVVVIAA